MCLADLIWPIFRKLALIEALDAGIAGGRLPGHRRARDAKAIRWHGEAQDKLYDQIAPGAPNALGLIVREPVGVVAAVLPWNFPLLMLGGRSDRRSPPAIRWWSGPRDDQSFNAAGRGNRLAGRGPPGVLNVVTGTAPAGARRWRGTWTWMRSL